MSLLCANNRSVSATLSVGKDVKPSANGEWVSQVGTGQKGGLQSDLFSVLLSLCWKITSFMTSMPLEVEYKEVGMLSVCPS